MLQHIKVLYFVDGFHPTAKEKVEAASIGLNVTFRNVNFCKDEISPEPCDAVMGKIPDLYKKCPTVEQLKQKLVKEHEELIRKAELAGESPAKVEFEEEPDQEEEGSDSESPSWGGTVSAKKPKKAKK